MPHHCNAARSLAAIGLLPPPPFSLVIPPSQPPFASLVSQRKRGADEGDRKGGRNAGTFLHEGDCQSVIRCVPRQRFFVLLIIFADSRYTTSVAPCDARADRNATFSLSLSGSRSPPTSFLPFSPSPFSHKRTLLLSARGLPPSMKAIGEFAFSSSPSSFRKSLPLLVRQGIPPRFMELFCQGKIALWCYTT